MNQMNIQSTPCCSTRPTLANNESLLPEELPRSNVSYAPRGSDSVSSSLQTPKRPPVDLCCLRNRIENILENAPLLPPASSLLDHKDISKSPLLMTPTKEDTPTTTSLGHPIRLKRRQASSKKAATSKHQLSKTVSGKKQMKLNLLTLPKSILCPDVDAMDPRGVLLLGSHKSACPYQLQDPTRNMSNARRRKPKLAFKPSDKHLLAFLDPDLRN